MSHCIRGAALGAAIALAGCADLPEVPADVCGNRVVDGAEDCDGATSFEGTACGEPETENACFYVCEGEASCPPGWGCGIDDRCRQPSGEFAPGPGSPWRFRVGDFVIGDVDGDGLNDLVGNDVSTITIRFGTDTGELPTELDLLTRQPTGALSFGRFDQDERLDAVVPTAGGLFALLGDEDGMEPVAYSSFQVPDAVMQMKLVTLEAYAGNIVSESLFFIDDIFEFSDAGASSPLPGSFTAADLAGRVPVGDLDDDRNVEDDAPLGRQEVALAFAGADRVYLYTPSGATEQTLQPAPWDTASIPLPPGASIRSGASFADVDGNGYLDVLISMIGAADEPRVMVTYNRTTGMDAQPQSLPVLDDIQDIDEWPLAVGDLDGDGMADYVFRQAIALAGRAPGVNTGPPSRLTPVSFNFAEPWAEAVIGDVNGDGLADVAAVVEGSDGVDFFLNSGTGLFNRFHVDTTRPPRALRVGDYDGDRVADVAFSEIGFFDEPDELSVIFGRTSGGPSQAVSMGRLGFIEAMEPSSTVLSIEGIDSITDLIVLSASFPERETRVVTIMQGSSSRRLLAPFLLTTGIGAEPDVPRRALIGSFSPDDDEARDVIALADGAEEVLDDGPVDGDTATRLYLIPGQGQDADLDVGSQQFITMPGTEEFDHTCAVFTVGDIDASGASAGRDEIVAIDNGGSCFGSGFSPRPRLMVVRTDASTPPLSREVVEMGGSYTVVRDLSLHDLDGDGDRDLLALFAGEYRVEDTPEGAAVVVVWNQGGALSLEGVTVLELDVAKRLFDVAPAHLDDDGIPELVTLAQAGLFINELDPETSEYGAPRRIPVRTGDGRLATGDLDGDGLDDVAFTDGNDVRVLLQEPAAARGAAADGAGGADAGADR